MFTTHSFLPPARSLLFSLRPFSASAHALLELTEDSPYKFNQTTPPTDLPKLQLLNPHLTTGFRFAYSQMLLQITENNTDTIKEIMEHRLSNEMIDYLSE